LRAATLMGFTGSFMVPPSPRYERCHLPIS
jgi:hypothetical protein